MSVGNLGTPIGSEEQFYISSETTFGTFVKPNTNDAISIKKSSFEIAQVRENRNDKRNSRSVYERVTRKKTASFTVTMYALPSGTAGTAPDIDAVLEAVYGNHTNTPATSDVYTLTKDINKSFTMHRILDDDWSESITGAVIDKITYRFKAEEEVEIEISGMAANYVHTSKTTLSASAASGSTGITVANASDFLSVNSVVKVGSQTNSGAGFRVTAIAGTAVTLESALSADVTISSVVCPYFPNGTVAGSPLTCIDGSVTFDGDAHYIQDFEVTLTNNLRMRNDEFGYAYARGFTASSRRMVEFSGTVYLDTDATAGTAYLRGKSQDFDNIAIVVTAGSTAGRIMSVSLPYAELNVLALEIPEEEEPTFALTGIAKASASMEDEISNTWQ